MSQDVSGCSRCGAAAIRDDLAACPSCLIEGLLEPPVLPDAPDGAPRFPGFHVVERLGTGGMGAVWLALQQTPAREVAIKVIRDDLDGEAVVARFSHELEALAAMDHPCIARVYAADRLPDGRPYFVMEYVEGETLDRYLAEGTIPLARRLDLFEDVCDAVAHAHQRLVIHRDLKASNVLIALSGGKPVPKLIDFGIARAIGRAPGKSTIAGEIFGTPASMSPEQTRPGEATDTRTDVYGLGVILYELLAGRPPFFEAALTARPIDEVLRIVREQEPTPPSASAVSNPKAIEGDLDAIALKAMAKEPSRRYPYADVLLEDLRRHRRSEPILARRAGLPYRASRFVRRHRWGVGVSAAVATIVVGATVALAIQYVLVRRARDFAEERRQDAVAVSAFMTGFLRQAAPSSAARASMTVREAADRAADAALHDFAPRPSARGVLLTALGQTQIALGNYAKAEGLLLEATTILRTATGPRSAEYAQALLHLANLETRLRKLADARRHLEEVLPLQAETYGAQSARVAEVLADLGDNAFYTDDLEASRAFYERSLAIERVVRPDHNPRIDRRLRDLGDVAAALGDFDGAIRYYEDVRRSFAARDMTETADYAVLQNNLGDLHIKMGRWDVARPALEEALRLSEQTQGPNHPDIAETLCLLARVEAHDGNVDRAEAFYRRALRITADPEGQGARASAEEGLREIGR